MNPRRTPAGAHALRALALVLGCLGAFAPAASAAYTPTASMATPRAEHTATPLPSASGAVERILVAGGRDATQPVGAVLGTAELYDVASGTWTPAGTMTSYNQANALAVVPRRGHLAVALPVSAALPQGGVFVAGGLNENAAISSYATLYNAATNAWSAITPTNFVFTQRTEVAAFYAGGRVVFAGGLTAQGIANGAVQFWNPATTIGGTYAAMGTARYGHAASVLADGRVLVSGGYTAGGAAAPALTSTEIFDPVANTWTPAAPLDEARAEHTSSRADATRVLVTGGVGTRNGAPFATSEIFDPATGAWSSAGAMSTARQGQQATVVRDGWLAITGGRNAASPLGLDSAESWTPERGWGGLYGLPAPEPIGGARVAHTATAIPETNEVLVAGGGTPAVATAVRYTPDLPAPVVPPAPLPPNTTPEPAPRIVAPEPVQNVSVAVTPVSGRVFVRIGTSDEFRELKAGEAIPTGTVLDTTDGRIRLTAAVGRGRQTADFYGGTFEVRQPRGEGGIVELRVVGKPTGCSSRTASAAVKRKRKPRVWGDGKGKFRTRGTNGSATVRGTKWLLEDRCSGTFVKVARGSVTVRDFPKRRSLVMRAPRSYLARPKPKRAR